MIINAVRLTTANQVLLASVMCYHSDLYLSDSGGDCNQERLVNKQTSHGYYHSMYFRLQVITCSASDGRCSGSGGCSAVGGSGIPSWTTTE